MKNARRAARLCLMWTLWKLSGMTNQLSLYSLYTFMNLARVYIEDHTVSMIDFIDWLFVK